MKTSKIATIVYSNYTENVDMLNPLFKQSELDALIKNDKDIISVEYYFNDVCIGTKMHSEKVAMKKIQALYEDINEIEDAMEIEWGSNWYSNTQRNEKRRATISKLCVKIVNMMPFVSESYYYSSGLGSDLCCSYEDWLG